MKPEAQRIAIAEACGYTWMTKFGSYTTHHFAQYKPKDQIELLSHGFVEGKLGRANDCDIYGLDQIPDYLNDLNAMAQAESFLMRRGRSTIRVYEDLLQKQVANIIFASAAQRAEAFLRTLDLWAD